MQNNGDVINAGRNNTGKAEVPRRQVEGTGEFLFTVFMMMLAAAGRALSRLFTAIGRQLAWLGDQGSCIPAVARRED